MFGFPKPNSSRDVTWVPVVPFFVCPSYDSNHIVRRSHGSGGLQRADPDQLTNLAPTAPPDLLAELHSELTSQFSCAGSSCA